MEDECPHVYLSISELASKRSRIVERMSELLIVTATRSIYVEWLTPAVLQSTLHDRCGSCGFHSVPVFYDNDNRCFCVCNSETT